MLTINLLPSAEKEGVWHEETQRIIRFFTTGILSACALAIVLIFPIYFSLLLEERELERSLNVEEAASRNLNIDAELQKIRTAENRIKLIRDFISTPATASTMLEKFFENTGSGITLISLTVKKQGDVAITGIATTRRNLLRFEKTLRDASMFQDISFPISNIVRETNINFTMQGKLKPPYTLR
ncbi:MAG: hypothetical protein HYT98_05130 [Candidatus Sungbacteria bacterium]|nr:hypothetical protein [Candidatus Sungbacteria bacterium]